MDLFSEIEEEVPESPHKNRILPEEAEKELLPSASRIKEKFGSEARGHCERMLKVSELFGDHNAIAHYQAVAVELFGEEIPIIATEAEGKIEEVDFGLGEE